MRPRALCLALVPLGAGAQSGMSKVEAAQLYTAAGFPIVRDQPVNRCRKPAKPRVTFVDINSDGRPEALFVDDDAGCYAPSGRYFAVLAKEGTSWRRPHQRHRIDPGAVDEDRGLAGHARHRFRAA